MTAAKPEHVVSPHELSGEGGQYGGGVANIDEVQAEDEQDHGESQDGDEETEEQESAPIIKPRNPLDPTPGEREEHDATHRPFRPWCPSCVKARGKEDPHYSQVKKENDEGMPTWSFDYAHIGDEAEEKENKTILVGRDKWKKHTFVHSVECKGCGDPNIVDRAIKAMDEPGNTKVILKGDGGPALIQVQDAVKKVKYHTKQL